ncbi:MAG: hypothetical protein O7J95_04640 [Planctomycetota bacterium]|nr:hypothetical protein [Planctomycetota bacterium]
MSLLQPHVRPAACALLALLAGCADRSSDDPPARRVKPGSGLRLTFEEPANVEAGTDLLLRLSIEGRAGQHVAVRLVPTPGVEISAYREATPVVLGDDGRRRLELSVRVPRPRGCAVTARVTGEDGRTEEAHCVLGGPGVEAPPRVLQGEDGRGVRVGPSRESP